MKVALCLVVKNEQTEIIYWLAWHKALGFDSFIIYNDFSNDKTEEVILSLSNFLDIRYMRNKINHDLHNIRQVRAYNDALIRYGSDFDWIALFDADEYLDLYGSDIKTYLSSFSNKSLIAFNWCNAGTNGHISRPDGAPFLSYQRHGRRDLFWNRHTKVIFRPEKILREINQVHNVCVSGESVDSEGISINWEGSEGGFTKNSPTWNRARLMHYQSRSIEHYVARDRNLEDVRRDKRDPLHTVTNGEEYNSICIPFSPINVNKFFNVMLDFSYYQSLTLARLLKSYSPTFLSELSSALSPALVSIFQPSYIAKEHEINSNWISRNHEPGNILKDQINEKSGVVAFTLKNAFGHTLGEHNGELSLSNITEKNIIGLYFLGSKHIHLFSQKRDGFRVQGDARILPALTYMVWGKGDSSISLSHPRTGRFLGFRPDGGYSINKIRALDWECFQLDLFDLSRAPSHIQDAADWLGKANSLLSLREKCDPQDCNPLFINAVTALDEVSIKVINLISHEIIGEHLL